MGASLQQAIAALDSIQLPTKKKKSGGFGVDAHDRYTEQRVQEPTSFNEADLYSFDAGQSVSSVLLGSGRRQARTRTQIYQKWSFMEGDVLLAYIAPDEPVSRSLVME